MPKPNFVESNDKKIPVRELMIDSGIHIDSDGQSHYATQEEVVAWKYVVERNGLS